ncbi:MAG: hypothetical protein WDO74_15170 [Pseudomonadota bacterium]
MAHWQYIRPSFRFSALLLRARTIQKFSTFLLVLSALSGCGADAKPAATDDGAAGASGTAGHNCSTAGQGDSGSAGDSGSGNAGEGGTGNGGTGGEDARGALELIFTDRFVMKVQARSDGSLLVLLDKPLDMRVDSGSPQRELLLLDARGQRLESIAVSSNSRFLLDFAVHDSGDLSVLYSSATEYSLERFNAEGHSVAASALSDPQINTDPPVLTGAPDNAIETLTRDTGRIAAFGEQLLVATRTGRHSVLAYRFGFFDDGSGPAFHAEWRTLVVPPFALGATSLYGGSYDTFSAVQAQAMLHLAVDQAGTIYVAVQHPRLNEAALPKVHAKVFGEILVGDADAQDLYVTRIAPGGTRLGTTVVGTPEDDQLFGLRGGQDSALVIGRKEHWNEQGTGFDALVARLDGQSGTLEMRELDVQRSDLGFDALPLSDGSWLVTGASHWQQNPNGASVSEESQAFLQRISSSGERSPIALPNGLRHNEGRTLLPLGPGRWLVGGMTDGPGTHSGDADASRVRASGFLCELRLDLVGATD